MQKVTLYSDGSSRGNPGPGGFGTVLLYEDREGRIHRREYSGGYRSTTNNRMELLGVITGLEKLLHPCLVDIYTDSQYLVRAFNDHWIDNWQKKGWRNAKNQPVKNADLWMRLLEAASPHEIRLHWVKGHAGNPENERCDALAVAAAGGDDLPADDNYETET